LVLAAATVFRPDGFPREPIRRAFTEGLAWHERAFENALDACFDLTLLEGRDTLRGHQLCWRYVGERTGDLPADQWSVVSSFLARLFLDEAEKVKQTPTDAAAVKRFLAFPPSFHSWSHVSSAFDGHEEALYGLGTALSQLGGWSFYAREWFERAVAEAAREDAFGRVDHEHVGRRLHQIGCRWPWPREASGWFKRAVAAKEQGDAHGRVDHVSLGKSLHETGRCYLLEHQFEEAQPWFERAIEQFEQVDVNDRDYEQLGRSLHDAGFCLSFRGRFEEAQRWFERAVAAKEHDDGHGRVDHDSLGLSLHELGATLSLRGRFDEARVWFERAAVETERGNAHGRVDHEAAGRSLDQVGNCYSSLGRFDEARVWFERAVAAKARGDVYGRVDGPSLGDSRRNLAKCLKEAKKGLSAIGGRRRRKR
jgi:tetratricopeptide (TPR) repeat protein